MKIEITVAEYCALLREHGFTPGSLAETMTSAAVLEEKYAVRPCAQCGIDMTIHNDHQKDICGRVRQGAVEPPSRAWLEEVARARAEHHRPRKATRPLEPCQECGAPTRGGDYEAPQ